MLKPRLTSRNDRRNLPFNPKKANSTRDKRRSDQCSLKTKQRREMMRMRRQETQRRMMMDQLGRSNVSNKDTDQNSE